MRINLFYGFTRKLFYIFFVAFIILCSACKKNNPTPAPAANQAPVANAGADQAITLPVNQVSLTGTGTDIDGTITSFAWTKASGPAGETITTAASANTTVTGLVGGVYIFKLTVTDNSTATDSDSVQVTVNPAVPSATYDYFVSSQNTNSVKRYNGITGAYMGDFVAPGSGGLSATQEVRWGLDGQLLVVGANNSSILSYDTTTGNFLGQFTTGYTLQTPTKMSFGPDGKIYVSQWDATQNKIARFNGTTGAFIDEFTSVGLGANNAMGHAWDAAGRLYVACYSSREIRRFDVNGNFIDVFIPQGSGAGQLLGPVNLWFDNNNNLYIANWGPGIIKKYNATTGAYISDFITGLNHVEGFTFDKAGKLYLCNYNSNAVNKYDGNGTLLGVVLSGGGLNVANSVIIGPSN